MSRRALPLLSLAIMFLAQPVGCRKSENQPEPPSRDTRTNEAGSSGTSVPGRERPAITVNGKAIPQSELQGAARTLGVSEEEALKLAVQAEVVAQEARASNFPGALPSSDRFELSKQYLETVYSSDTLCGNIRPREIEQFYELSYRPEWPVDVYHGLLVEVRCCQRLDLTDCDALLLEECLLRNAGAMEALHEIKRTWTGDRPSLDQALARFPNLLLTDFGLLDWPGIPDANRRPRQLLPQSVVDQLRTVPVGGVLGPLASPIGYHLLKLTKKRGAIKADSPEFLGAARRTLCQQRIEQTRWDYVKRLVESAVVERHGDGRPPRHQEQ